jgi:hypothetical protein
MLNHVHRVFSKQYNKVRRVVVKRRHVDPVLASVPEDARILEIGGGYNPRYVKSRYRNAFHLDHCPTDELRAKYAAIPEVAHHVGRIQEVDFVFDGAPIETVIPADLRFDVIYGSHVLEHQVDLIGHLQSLEKLLAPGGRVIEIIPDYRRCFDALRYPTVTSDALVVHMRRPAVHQGKQVFDSMARAISANPGRPVTAADLMKARFSHDLRSAYEAVMALEVPGAAYQDAHAWTFRPESFQLLMIELLLLGLTRLRPRMVSPSYDNQFCAVLEPVGADPSALDAQAVAALERRRLELCKSLRV